MIPTSVLVRHVLREGQGGSYRDPSLAVLCLALYSMPIPLRTGAGLFLADQQGSYIRYGAKGDSTKVVASARLRIGDLEQWSARCKILHHML